MIREFERNILENIQFVNKYLESKGKFIYMEKEEYGGKGFTTDKKTFMSLIDPKYNLKDEGMGYFIIQKKFKEYTFELGIKKYSGGGLDFDINILFNGILQDTGESLSYGWILNFLPFDKSKINN